MYYGIMNPPNNHRVTVELNELIESGVNIWDFDYPSYYKGDEKSAFEQKVIDHYRFREIGQETPARFMHYFRTRIREIMPYYIQLYKSCELMDAIEDPFESYNLTEEYTENRSDESRATGTSSDTASAETGITGERENTSGSTTTGTSDNTKKFSNTPQGSISNLDDYLTEATVDDASRSESVEASETTSETNTTTTNATNTGSTENTSENTGTVTHKLTRKGNIGVQPLGAEITALRNSFINVDMMIIDELKDLFIQIY